MTVIKAMTLTGWFTKWGSSSNVKILRIKNKNAGYESIKVNIKAAMKGDTDADITLESGDIIVVSEGIF